MSWVKLDDKFTEHPKLVNVGPLGIALQVAALCYSNANLTDGFIPINAVQKLISFEFSPPGDSNFYNITITSKNKKEKIDWKLVSEWIVNAGIWEKVDGGFHIHDYELYQPLKKAILDIHDSKVEAGRNGGIVSGRSRRNKTESKDEAESKQNRSKTEAETKQTVNIIEENNEPNDEAKTNPVPVPVLKELKDCEIKNQISLSNFSEESKITEKQKIKKGTKPKLKPDDLDFWKFLKENEQYGLKFYEATKLFPVGNQFGLWVEACRELRESGVTPEVIPKAVDMARFRKWPIKSPKSILTAAREIKMNQETVSSELEGWILR